MGDNTCRAWPRKCRVCGRTVRTTNCQRQLNSEHFRQSKIDPITVDGCFAKLELTHLLVIAQRQCQQLSAPLFRQRSGLWELSLALREDTAGRVCSTALILSADSLLLWRPRQAAALYHLRLEGAGAG